MNTKLIMTSSAIIFGVLGVLLSFAPDLVQAYLKFNEDPNGMLLFQVIGGLYLGFALLNWMAKSSIIGGIYNRPIAMANFMHYMIVAFAIMKQFQSHHDLPIIYWMLGAVYVIFALVFGIILFTHPLKEKTN